MPVTKLLFEAENQMYFAKEIEENLLLFSNNIGVYQVI